MEDDVAEEVKKRRLQEMIDTWRSDAAFRNERDERDFVHSSVPPGVDAAAGRLHLVLVEGPAKRPLRDAAGVERAALTGRTDTNKRILFADQPVGLLEPTGWRPGGSGGTLALGTTLVPGDYAVVRATEAKGHTLRGEPLAKTSLCAWSQAEWDMV